VGWNWKVVYEVRDLFNGLCEFVIECNNLPHSASSSLYDHCVTLCYTTLCRLFYDFCKVNKNADDDVNIDTVC